MIDLKRLLLNCIAPEKYDGMVQISFTDSTFCPVSTLSYQVTSTS